MLLELRKRCALTMFVVMAMVSVPVAGAEEPEHFLEYSEYNFAVNFISGNLTATVTPSTLAPRDWPRVIFEHNTDIMSPTFDVGISAMYLFNDTDGNGVFSRSEATHIAYLSSLYNVTWAATPVDFGNDTVGGEYAWLRANATIGLFQGPEDVYPIIDKWANVTFWFQISEKPVIRQNSYGNYAVQGMVDVRMNFTIDILQHVDATGLALEQRMSAGGSTNMFMVREDTGNDTPELTVVDGRNDETVNGDNFTHAVRKTMLPSQDILFAKEDQTVQAHYRVSSEPFECCPTPISQIPMNISYYTTGEGLVVHTAYFPAGPNETISHEVIVGIEESGFTPRFRDWLTENLPMVMVVTGSIAAVVSIVILVFLVRKHWGWGKKAVPPPPPEKEA